MQHARPLEDAAVGVSICWLQRVEFVTEGLVGTSGRLCLFYCLSQNYLLILKLNGNSLFINGTPLLPWLDACFLTAVDPASILVELAEQLLHPFVHVADVPGLDPELVLLLLGLPDAGVRVVLAVVVAYVD